MSAFLGFCHVSGGDAPSRLVAAAFCADRPQFEALVGAALAAQGYRLDRAEDVLPAGPWTARHPTADGEALARLVHAERHVAFGPMTPLGGADAPWEKAQNWLHVQELGPVTPLDAQFGVHPKKFVPDALQDVLFGQPEPTEAERAAFGENIPPQATYAVLDAAKMPYLLTSLLETSGLRYQSLFQGEAQEDLGEHAPYLVELKGGHDFIRRLFTGPEGVGGLWEKELGIFIRSRAGFDALRRHLRKFYRCQIVESGNIVFLRYWEPELLARLIDMNLGHIQGLVTPQTSVIACYDDTAHVLTAVSTSARRPGTISLEEARQIGLLLLRHRRSVIAGQIGETFPDHVEHLSERAIEREVQVAWDAATQFRLRDGEVRANFIILSVALAPGFYLDDTVAKTLFSSRC